MCADLKIIDPRSYEKWNECLFALPQYSFFHTANWAAVLHESYNYIPLYFTLFDLKELKAVIPLMEIKSWLTGKRAVSLPFSDYCEPICAKKECLTDVLSTIGDYGKKAGWKYFEIRGGENILNPSTPAKVFYTHTLELSKNEDRIFAKFSTSTRRNVKKAVKLGVKVKSSKSRASIIEFYRLNCITRKKHGLPPQPFHFFEQIFKHVISKNLGIIVTAEYQNKIIAAAIYFHFGDKALYKYSASDKAFQHLKANNLVMWEAIKWFKKNGYKTLCFGRTELEHTGLRQFKVGWGTEEQLIQYYKYDFLREAYISEKPKTTASYHRFMTKVPIPMLKLAGSLLYKHMG